MSKICNECNIEKSVDLFHKRNKIEHKGKCKECIYKISVLDIGKKKCTQCNNEKPLECFSKFKRNKCGYRGNCKECENNKVYKGENENNKICIKCNIEKPINDFYLRKKNSNRYNNYCKKCDYEKQKNYRKNNKEELNLKNREQQKERLKTDIEFKIKRNLGRRLHHALNNNLKKLKTKELLDCSIEYFKNWISYQFEDWMSWENYGEWQLDHVKPCASFDMTKIEEQQDCFHWKNYRPLSKKINISKSNKIDDELIKQHKILSDNYEKNIIN
uniref:Uncharacterized protein n=1 Tax=viral metagenome TaxID=1070528 RepID=A0A6C0HT43_9ZZZZ